MHEMSLAQNLISQLQALAVEHNMAKVLHIKVEIGLFSGVVVDSFEFGFSILAAEYELTKDTVLEIVQPLASFICLACGALHKGQARKPSFCPTCQANSLSPKGGNDLILLQVEME